MAKKISREKLQAGNRFLKAYDCLNHGKDNSFPNAILVLIRIFSKDISRDFISVTGAGKEADLVDRLD